MKFVARQRINNFRGVVVDVQDPDEDDRDVRRLTGSDVSVCVNVECIVGEGFAV